MYLKFGYKFYIVKRVKLDLIQLIKSKWQFSKVTNVATGALSIMLKTQGRQFNEAE